MVIAKEFEYRRPTTLAEATQVLAQHPGSVKVLAGGTDLVAWLRDDAIAPDLVIDIKAIPDLRDIKIDGDVLHIGSLVTFTELIESDVVKEHVPLLAEMAETVASPGIRNRATMVGNICSAVPSCDAGPVLLAYDTAVHLTGPSGNRSVDSHLHFFGTGLVVAGQHVLMVMRLHHLAPVAGGDTLAADHQRNFRLPG